METATPSATLPPVDAASLRLAPVSPPHFASLAKFCASLQGDVHPSSFWGLTERDIPSLAKPPKTTVMALSGETIVGLGVITRGGVFQEHCAEISLAVAVESRRRGIAGLLAAELETSAAKLGIRLIKALILENNAPSRRFFARRGYEHAATLRDEFNLPGVGFVNDCVYYRRLAPRP